MNFTIFSLANPRPVLGVRVRRLFGTLPIGVMAAYLLGQVLFMVVILTELYSKGVRVKRIRDESF